MVKDEIEKNPNYREEITPYMDDMVKKLGLPVKGDLSNTNLVSMGDTYYDTVANAAARAEEGDILAQRFFAKEHDDPGYKSSIKKDPEAARMWYTRAAEQGAPQDQYKLAQYMDRTAEGGGLEKYKQSLPWVKRAAEQGHGGAQYRLGSSRYLYDLSGEEADMWLRKSADRGNAKGMYSLAMSGVAAAERAGRPVDAETMGWLTKTLRTADIDSNWGGEYMVAHTNEMLGDIYAASDKKKAIRMYENAINKEFGYSDSDIAKLEEKIKALKAESPINSAIRSVGGNVAEWLGYGPIKARR